MTAIEDTICEDLDCDVIEAALLIREKVDDNMANGLFTELRARGYDPKDFTMLAYGATARCTAAALRRTSTLTGSLLRHSARCSQP